MNERHIRILTDMLTGNEATSRMIVDGPYFISECNAEFLTQIQRITGTVPGPWPAPPNFDDHGNDLTLLNDGVIDEPFSMWANPYNQEELLNLSNTIDFEQFIVVDCGLPEEFIRDVFDSETRTSDISIIKKGLAAIEALSWFAMAVDPDAIRLLFVCSPTKQKWIDELRSVLGELDDAASQQ
jgi:hypothetical protein